MTKPDKPTGKEAARAERERRLAEALRANLRRRKAPARASDGAAARRRQDPENAAEAAEIDD
jgi:hypothetical protein